jgi:hypothetical protein
VQVVGHRFRSICWLGAAILLSGESGARAPLALQERCKIVNIRPGHPAHPGLDVQTAKNQTMKFAKTIIFNVLSFFCRSL